METEENATGLCLARQLEDGFCLGSVPTMFDLSSRVAALATLV